MSIERHAFGKWAGDHWRDHWPALSLRQPWLWAIFELKKPVENRRWSTRYRGPIWLHAAKGCTRGEACEALEWMRVRGLLLEPARWPGLANVERGGICGVAEIVGVMGPSVLGFDSGDLAWRAWHMPGQYGFRLQHVRRFPIVLCNGALGLFSLPPDIERLAAAALAAKGSA